MPRDISALGMNTPCIYAPRRRHPVNERPALILRANVRNAKYLAVSVVYAQYDPSVRGGVQYDPPVCGRRGGGGLETKNSLRFGPN